ncbi:MAG: winged helix-turn-helix transcriptional regulator [Firmicutes bacterium]|nr:winged helix-turn-helix transcriptional regulator [Bacillota bacterium]
MRFTEERLSKIRLLSKHFKGFSDYSRLLILYALFDNEKTVSDLVAETGLSQSGISNHLKCLKECDLLVDRQESKFVFYCIKDDRTRQILALTEAMMKDIAEERYQCLRY